jgi:hypothetical protein
MKGRLFGALLNIGDRRVCDLLIPWRDSLDRDAINNVVNCSTGFIHSVTANFYLDWLKGMEGTDQDRVFGIVASGLALLKKEAKATKSTPNIVRSRRGALRQSNGRNCKSQSRSRIMSNALSADSGPSAAPSFRCHRIIR